MIRTCPSASAFRPTGRQRAITALIDLSHRAGLATVSAVRSAEARRPAATTSTGSAGQYCSRPPLGSTSTTGVSATQFACAVSARAWLAATLGESSTSTSWRIHARNAGGGVPSAERYW